MAKAMQRPRAAAMGDKEPPEEHFLACAVPPHPEPDLPVDLDPNRASAIFMLANKWANGTVLHYWFFDEQSSTAKQRGIVREAFTHWKKQGIGLEFTEVDDPGESELRIRFVPGGSWSYVGNYNTRIPLHQETMNFGWDLGDGWGWATALHEIGHALGLPHEHQNPQAGIVWNEEKVIEEYIRTQGWSREKVIYNIIRKIPGSEVQGTKWDPESIMHYPFRVGLIKAPPPYDTKPTPRNVKLSPADVAFIRELYPPLTPATTKLQPMMLEKLDIRPGEQADFVIEPEISQKYVISTVGPSDSKMVLFEERDGKPRFVAADDDSAAERNARLEQKLIKGRKYILRVRLHHLQSSSGIGVMMV